MDEYGQLTLDGGDADFAQYMYDATKMENQAQDLAQSFDFSVGGSVSGLAAAGAKAVGKVKPPAKKVAAKTAPAPLYGGTPAAASSGNLWLIVLAVLGFAGLGAYFYFREDL